jgi:hypothetical protein
MRNTPTDSSHTVTADSNYYKGGEESKMDAGVTRSTMSLEERIATLEAELDARAHATDEWRKQMSEWAEREHAQTELLRTILVAVGGAAGVAQDFRLPAEPPVWPLSAS